MSKEKYYWLNKDSRKFLSEDYLLEGVTPEQRIKEIANNAEKILGIKGFSEKFEGYMERGFYSLATPVWTNFGIKRGLPVSCFGSFLKDTIESIFDKNSEVGYMSKMGGGTSGYFGDLRARGTPISVGGESSGPVHFMELFSVTADVVSQGCYDDQTEILTDSGWRLFKELPKIGLDDIKIAQVNEDETISFVNIIEFFEYDVSENLLWFKDSKNIDLLVTKNHNMVYKTEKKSISVDEHGNKKYNRFVDGDFYSKTAETCPTHRDIKYLHSAYLPLGNELSDWERILIATQADGGLVKRCENAIKYRFIKKRKADRLRYLLEKTGIEYSYSYYNEDKTHNFYVNFGHKLPKTLEWVDISNKSYQWCTEFISEILEWDGSKTSDENGTYSSTLKINIDKVQEVCAVSGYKSSSGIDNRENEPTKSPIYKIYLSKGNYFGLENIEKQEVFYQGKVYCVEVPSNRLIVRRGGKTVVCGNSARRGSFAATLPVEHPDIEEFLQIRSVGHSIQNMSIGVSITDKWMQEMVDGDKAKRKIWSLVIKKRYETGYPYIMFVDTANNNAPQVYKDKGLKINNSNLCQEIFLHNNPEESFVCVLSSLNLLHWDEIVDTDAVETLIYFLDAVNEEFITKTENMKFMQAPRKFAIKQRALGAGVLGWHSLLQSKMIAFESMEAKLLNNSVFKTIRDRADKATQELAQLLGEPELLKGYGRRNVTTMAIAPTTSCATPDTKFKDGNNRSINYWEFCDMGGLDLDEIMLITIFDENGNKKELKWDQLVRVSRLNEIIEVYAHQLVEGDDII